MSTATTAPLPGTVRFRHRRRPPALQFGVIGAVFLLLCALAASALAWQVAFVAAAIAAAALGWLGRERLVFEEQLITDAAVALARPDGTYVEIPFAHLARASTRRNGVVFTRDDGALLAFDRSPHAKRMRGLLAELAPSVGWVDEVDLACDT